MSERGRSGRPGAEVSSREAFVEATARLLQRQGYSGTGLNEIVARSGAPRGSLYFHFPGGKRELAAAAMELSGGRLRDAIATILARSDGTGPGLAALVDALAAGLLASGFRDGCPIATVTLETATGTPELRAAAATVFDSWLDAIAAHLRAGGLEADAAARRALLVLASIEGALILARAREDTTPLQAVREELLTLP